jgi:protein phosphatase
MSSNRQRRIHSASLSDVGRVRSSNQDTCAEFENENGDRMLVVADGMGGHSGGATASRLALETIGQLFENDFDDSKAMLERAFQAANEKIHQIGSTDPTLHNMGTTGVAVLLGTGNTGWVAHIGDSRAYRSRAGVLDQITQDHSWVSEEVRCGRITAEEAKTHTMRNVLLRSIGVEPHVEVTVSTIDLQPGDRFLLCSDGLWGEVEDGAIAEILAREDPTNAARQLVDLANENGGSDNITVQIAALIDGDDGAPPKIARDNPTAHHSDNEPPRSSESHRSIPETGPGFSGSRWAQLWAIAIGSLLTAAVLWRGCG